MAEISAAWNGISGSGFKPEPDKKGRVLLMPELNLQNHPATHINYGIIRDIQAT